MTAKKTTVRHRCKWKHSLLWYGGQAKLQLCATQRSLGLAGVRSVLLSPCVVCDVLFCAAGAAPASPRRASAPPHPASVIHETLSPSPPRPELVAAAPEDPRLRRCELVRVSGRGLDPRGLHSQGVHDPRYATRHHCCYRDGLCLWRLPSDGSLVHTSSFPCASFALAARWLRLSAVVRR